MSGWARVANQALGGWGAMAQDLIESDDHSSAAALPARADADTEAGHREALAPPTKPEVDDMTLEALRAPIGVAAERPSLTGVCQQTLAWVEHCGLDAVHLDPVIPKLNQFFVASQKTLHTSKEVLGRLIEEHPSKIEGALAALAASYFHWDRLHQEKLESLLSQSGVTLLQYIEQVKYDETPMKITERQVVHHASAQSMASASAPAAADSVASLPSSSSRGLTIGKATTKAKLFATESRYGMVLKMPMTGGLSVDHVHVLLTGSTVTNLQMLESATTSVMKQAVLANRSVSTFAKDFIQKVRVCTVDQAPANAATERSIMAGADSWTHLQFPCHVHILAICHAKSFHLVEQQVQGLIHFSLSLSLGSAMARFRKSLAAILENTSNYVITRGEPPDSAVQHRSFLIDLFCQSGTNVALKQHLLAQLPNGNWARQDKIELWIPGGVEFEEAKLYKDVGAVLLLCLAGRGFRVYPKHRWQGADIAVDLAGACPLHSWVGSACVPAHDGLGQQPAGHRLRSQRRHPPPTASSRESSSTRRQRREQRAAGRRPPRLTTSTILRLRKVVRGQETQQGQTRKIKIGHTLPP